MQPPKTPFMPFEHFSPSAVRQARVKAAQAIGTYTEEDWKQILEECGNACACCHDASVPLERDHAIPVASPRCTEDAWNMQPLCRECNMHKGMTSQNFRMMSRAFRVFRELGDPDLNIWLVSVLAELYGGHSLAYAKPPRLPKKESPMTPSP